jgi:hypothetical protein
MLQNSVQNITILLTRWTFSGFDPRDFLRSVLEVLSDFGTTAGKRLSSSDKSNSDTLQKTAPQH